MINVQVNETTLLNLLMDRLEYWTTNSNTLQLYEKYFQDLIFNGCFEGAELDVNLIVDNLYINDTAVTDREGLSKEYGIEANDCSRILASDKANNLYLVSTY
jgi:hypothetical protein